MAYDRATHVGCAFARYSDSYHTGLFACNYASGNIKGYRVYKCGKPGGGCIYGRNPNYPALCSINEPIDPNQVYWEALSILSHDDTESFPDWSTSISIHFHMKSLKIPNLVQKENALPEMFSHPKLP